jgi:hypothetical protein
LINPRIYNIHQNQHTDANPNELGVNGFQTKLSVSRTAYSLVTLLNQGMSPASGTAKPKHNLEKLHSIFTEHIETDFYISTACKQEAFVHDVTLHSAV